MHIQVENTQASSFFGNSLLQKELTGNELQILPGPLLTLQFIVKEFFFVAPKKGLH